MSRPTHSSNVDGNGGTHDLASIFRGGRARSGGRGKPDVPPTVLSGAGGRVGAGAILERHRADGLGAWADSRCAADDKSGRQRTTLRVSRREAVKLRVGSRPKFVRLRGQEGWRNG